MGENIKFLLSLIISGFLFILVGTTVVWLVNFGTLSFPRLFVTTWLGSSAGWLGLLIVEYFITPRKK